jgi:hypothetical protein
MSQVLPCENCGFDNSSTYSAVAVASDWLPRKYLMTSILTPQLKERREDHSLLIFRALPLNDAAKARLKSNRWCAD